MYLYQSLDPADVLAVLRLPFRGARRGGVSMA